MTLTLAERKLAIIDRILRIDDIELLDRIKDILDEHEEMEKKLKADIKWICEEIEKVKEPELILTIKNLLLYHEKMNS